MDYEDLKVLEELRRNGSITDEEYRIERNKILNKINNPSQEKQFWGMTENSYIALMHISQLFGYIVPFLGFLAPIVLWVINKDNSVKVDLVGKNILNFMLSWFIYILCVVPFCLIVIGIPIIVALATVWIIFIIVATIKAGNGEHWKYPLTLNLIK